MLQLQNKFEAAHESRNPNHCKPVEAVIQVYMHVQSNHEKLRWGLFLTIRLDME